MAPNPLLLDSFYLSPLDKCFSDGHRLISWRTAFEALSDADLDLVKQSDNLQHFLQDELSINALAHASSPVKRPNAQSKSDFETRTAAVNATPTKTESLDTEQIKSDTLWLSEQADIDEVSALRLVVLEWQDRPASRLLNGFPEEELISVAKAVGNSQVANISPNQPGSHVDSDKSAFDSDDVRHSRLLYLVLLEREYLLAVKLILRIAYGLRSPSVPPGRVYGLSRNELPLPWIASIVDKLNSGGQDSSKTNQSDITNGNFMTDGVEVIRTALAAWEAGTQWASMFDDPPSFEMAYRTSQLRFVLLQMQLLAAQVASSEHSPSASAVQAWFEFVGAYGFLELLQAQAQEQVSLVEQIQALVSLVSLQTLRLPFTVTYLIDRSSISRPPPIIHDAACRNQIDQTLRQAADRLSPIASPAIFAWSLVLQTLCDAVNPSNEETFSDDDSSFTDAGSPVSSRQAVTNLPSNLNDIRDSLMQNNPDVDPVEFYARAAVDGCSVLDVVALLAPNLQTECGDSWNISFNLNARISLLELARQALVGIGYRPEVFQCILEILDCGAAFDEVSPVATDLANVFMSDNEVLVPRLLHQAYLRYPYEISPLLKLCKSLVRTNSPDRNRSPVAQPLCDPSPSFTQILPVGFSGYELVREDENANGVRLTEELPIIINRAWRKLLNLKLTSGNSEDANYASDQEPGEFCIPEGTTGVVISESRPFVVAWDHLHFPLRYLACLLSTATASSSRLHISADEALVSDTQADIILILAKLVNSSSSDSSSATNSSPSTAQVVLEEASELLDRNQDIISVVFEIFEQQLSDRAQPLDDSSITIVVSCLEFFSSILKAFPGRIWPLLTRSQLLDIDGKGGVINAFIAAESSIGSSRFLTACLALLDALRKDIVAQSVVGTSSQQSSSKRFQHETKMSQSLPKKTMAKVTYALTRSIADALQGLHTRPLITVGLKTSLSTIAVRIFRDILLNVYGHDNSRQPAEKICGALAPAAKLILDSATTFTDSGLVTSILLSISIPAPGLTKFQLHRIPNSSIRDCTCRSLDLLSTLLDINLLHETPTLHLEQHLLQIIPVFVRLYSIADTYKTSILSLLSSLAQRIGYGATQPPSLLGSLEAGNACAFLTLLTSLNKPLGAIKQEVKIWNLAATVVNSSQQWMASFLMTGNTPKNALRRITSEHSRKNTMLNMAIAHLSETQEFHHLSKLAALTFLLQAQNSWPWVTNTIRKSSDFIPNLLNYVDGLSKNMSRAELEEPNQTFAAALIAEITATYTHNLRQSGDTSLIELIASKLGFFRDNAVALPTYNSSLHSNLKRNLAQKFPGCDLEAFKRILGASEFGRDYCYDVRFAGQVLKYHQAWKGNKDKGFEEELSRANSNLSLVEAQLLLVTGWKTLCIELCQSLANSESLQKQMVSVANNCLLSNIQSNLPESVFGNLLQTRAELALMILQKLNSIGCTEPLMKRLLSTVWEAILASGHDFEIAFTGSGVLYYRTLLRVLFLSVQPHAYFFSLDAGKSSSHSAGSSTQKRESPDQTLPLLLEVTSKVICTGFKSLCAQLHEDRATVATSDFNLLISLLQAILRVKGISTHFSQLSLQLCDTGAHRYAVTLFSWADRLASETGNPVFGDVSVSFLRELSNIPQMSEFLAAEAILSQLNTAPIMAHLREGTSVGLQSIWSRGIIPLVLNMLVSVGDSFAAEATAFLNSFEVQLKRASLALGSNELPSRINPLAGSITLSSASELHTLAMISVALDRYRDSPAANAAAAAGYGEDLNWDRAVVKEDTEAWLQSSRAQLKAKIAPSSPREAQLQLCKALGTAHGGEDGCDNRLEELVVAELKGALSYLGGQI